jgi:hypothetical protein
MCLELFTAINTTLNLIISPCFDSVMELNVPNREYLLTVLRLELKIGHADLPRHRYTSLGED